MAGSRKRPRSELAERVAAELRRHVPSGAKLTLALSGGVDSIAALDILAGLAPSYSFALDCLHVNHRISPNAEAWARFARAAARRYDLKCTVRTVDIAPFRRLGVEGAARAARYAAFERARTDFLALAQHRDDQAETVLLQLVRGAGVAGLAGMAPSRPAGRRGPILVRPLLGASRAELEGYARQRGLQWVEDESNADERYARNFVRRRVMPLLADLNDAAAANLARSAAHLAEAHELARALAALDAGDAVRDSRLSAAALARLPRARAKNLLRWAIAEAGLTTPDALRLDEMLRQLATARGDAAVRLPLDGAEVRRYRDAIWIVPGWTPPPRGFRARWDGRSAWALPELGGTLRFKAVVGAGVAARALVPHRLEVRLRTGGEQFRPDRRRPRRLLKALLQERGVPPWERARLPLLYCAGKLVAVPGIGVAAAAAAAPGEPGWAISWAPERLKLPRSAKAMLK
jgi:tRNA(Ile)-lysidine synthase